MTWGQKGGGKYLGPWNHDRWLSQQRTHKFEYVFGCLWINQELKQQTVKVKLLKPTTPKNCIFMPFLDTNSHLTTKPYNFDIKCQSNSESYDQHGFCGTKFRAGSEFFNDGGSFLQRERVLWGWLAGPSLSKCTQLKIYNFFVSDFKENNQIIFCRTQIKVFDTFWKDFTLPDIPSLMVENSLNMMKTKIFYY